VNTVPDGHEKTRDLRGLPQNVQPGRDLWAGIEPRITSRRRNWQLPASLAASVVLVTAGIWIGRHLQDDARQSAATASATVLQASFRADPEYQRQRDALLRTLPEKLNQLPQESQQQVQQSLQSIQQAIETIEMELGRDAGNVLLQELLINATQEEMRVLTVVDTADDLGGRT
jgi:hypothetical protein